MKSRHIKSRCLKFRYLIPLALAIAIVPFGAFAHKAWLLPSQTVIAGENAWVTVDAAVSNDLFYFNHVPLQLERLVITASTRKARTAPPASTAACSMSSCSSRARIASRW